MTDIPLAHDQAIATTPSQPSRALMLLLAAGAGLSVASIYYAQPLLGVVAADLAAPPWLVGWIPTATQLGYAAGLLFLGPLADRFDRRRVILAKALALVVALLLAAAAPSVHALLAASALIGITATLAQDFVPAAAALAPASSRGRLVGTVMTGLLLGILLSRVLSGLVAEQFGWRAMFVAAALAVAAIGGASWRSLPAFPPSATLGYGALLRSLGTVWRQHPALRRAAVAQGLLGLGFSAFWSTLAVMLHGSPFHLGSAAAGAFGLAGAAGALAAPFAGRAADRRGPLHVVRLAAAVAAAAFLAMGAGSALPPTWQLVLLAVGTVVFDLGVQGALIAHQTIVYGLDAAARSRLNVVLMTVMFLGMAAGSGLGSLLLAHGGWTAVMVLAAVSAIAALGVQARPGAARA
ncbi:MAG TPA: MFS transporter [Ramlibacter sp.]|jgi:predicted MFS family arabinose efflux permease|uniref:MFS transporter n=1 Tax=Ramlibacter sp. TaxID=1917967 RepID=UPI002D278CE3|nr:MFS transporter [Ramlibacter sp.]HZY17822.1 MFS transporter [Ramlibacter sp.]